MIIEGVVLKGKRVRETKVEVYLNGYWTRIWVDNKAILRSVSAADLELGRKFIGIELKPEYFKTAVKNLKRAKSQQHLFGTTA